MWRTAIILVFLQVTVISSEECANSNCRHSNVAALVLARGGSKGIPLKNLAKLDNQSLLSRTLETIKAANVFNHIWVSTDHDLIAKEAKNFNVSVHRRTEDYSRDNTSSIESVIEFLQRHPEIDKLALVQCTSPYILPEYLKEAFEKFQLESAECVFSVQRSHKLRWKSDETGQIIPINFNPLKRPRRQDWDGELIENGMFYFSTRKLILEFHSFQTKSCSVVEVPAENSLEIDSPFDLKLAEMMIKHRKEEELKTAKFPN